MNICLFGFAKWHQIETEKVRCVVVWTPARLLRRDPPKKAAPKHRFFKVLEGVRLRASEVVAFFGVDFQDVTWLDEERDLDDLASLKHSWLGRVVCCVTFDAV